MGPFIWNGRGDPLVDMGSELVLARTRGRKDMALTTDGGGGKWELTKMFQKLCLGDNYAILYII